MTFPPLLPIPDTLIRLREIFPPGLEVRASLIREMAAKVIWVFQYGGMYEATGRLLRPSHIYFFTEDQATLTSDEERAKWLADSKTKGFRPAGERWYADTTREPIRDETIRTLLDIGAIGKIPGIATTSSKPIYYLKSDFAALFEPSLTWPDFITLARQWQDLHLSPAARARMTLLAAGKVRRADEVTVICPDGSVAKLAPGPSSLITKAVVEAFATKYLPAPALLWMSESGNKVRYHDDATAKALGLTIDPSKILPDIILANVGDSGAETHLIFIEVVASDGPMTQARMEVFLEIVRAAKFPEDQCIFGTAFEDRADGAFKKCLPQLAWGTFAWFRSEPECLVQFLSTACDLTIKYHR